MKLTLTLIFSYLCLNTGFAQDDWRQRIDCNFWFENDHDVYETMGFMYSGNGQKNEEGTFDFIPALKGKNYSYSIRGTAPYLTVKILRDGLIEAASTTEAFDDESDKKMTIEAFTIDGEFTIECNYRAKVIKRSSTQSEVETNTNSTQE